MERAGGFVHLFWYGDAPAVVLLELVLTFILGTLSCLIVFHKHRRAVFVAAALAGAAAVFWAMPLSENELVERGIVGVIANRLGRLSGATPEELEEHGLIGSAYYRTKAYLFGSGSVALPADAPAAPSSSSVLATIPIQTDYRAERARARQGFIGEWHYLRADGQQGTVVLTTLGNIFTGEYRFGEHVEPLRGDLQHDGRLHLFNARQFGKFVRPGTLYEGDFSQDAWLQLSADGNSVTVNTAAEGFVFAMELKVTEPVEATQE